jgi:regulator of sirC expression with transglutaminase-like and TPR domain
VIASIDFQSHERFLDYCRRPSDQIELEEGVWLLAQTRYSTNNIERGKIEINRHAVELSRRMDPDAAMIDWLGVMNDYLFNELGFHGDREDYYNEQNSYLNRALDRRAGIPISLCVIYLLIGWRLRLRIEGVGMPGHFICRAATEDGETFIDVFNQGEILTRDDCISLIRRAGHAYRSEMLKPSSAREILARMCGNLFAIYTKKEHPTETRWQQEFIKALNGPEAS